MPRTLPVLLLLLAAAPAQAQRLTVTGGPADAAQVVVSTPVPLAASVIPNAVTLPDGTHVPVQGVPPALADKEKGSRIVFILPQLKAGETVTVLPTTLNYVKAPPQFTVGEEPGLVNVTFDGRPVLQFFAPKRDAKDHYYTFKPFHHVYDPSGKVLLTNGSAKTAKDGTFPHHRGLFFAWNKVGYGDKKTADVWHGTNNVYAEHQQLLTKDGGEVLGRHRAAITWNGPDGAAFANEERELTAYATKGGTLIDFASVVRTELPSVKLDGDPQHAGFHFRANMEVASKESAKQTYYLRPDGKGKTGETRNWDPKAKDPRTINLPWDACSFVVGGKRYTVLRVGHPDNPGEARGSERDYGRFGDYFEYEITPAKPLRVRYRVWAQEGEMTVAEAAAIAAAFRSPVAVK